MALEVADHDERLLAVDLAVDVLHLKLQRVL